MTTPGHRKINCPYCDGHIEFPKELIGQWFTCPHCQREIPLDPPTELAAALKLNGSKRTSWTRHWWLIALVAVVPLWVLFVAWALKSDQVVKVLGNAVPTVVAVILSALALFWAVCLFLLPIIVYFIYRTLLKIERNTRPK
jgi:polyferredoxin